ncbi:MAG: HNH endonuclease [Acidobacteriaceae bacterium]
MTTRRYTQEELQWLEENQTLFTPDYLREFCVKFNRTDVTAGALRTQRQKRGWKVGRTKSPFKKGVRPPNYRGPGHEGRDHYGFVTLVVEERWWNGRKMTNTRTVCKHRWLWEKANGPLGKGVVLKCLNGNKDDTDPSNWQAIPRAMLPRLSATYGRNYDRAPAELKPTIMAVSLLEHLAQTRAKLEQKETADE